MSLSAEDTQWITENFPEYLDAFKELSEVTEATPVPELEELATDERLLTSLILIAKSGKLGVAWGKHHGIGIGPGPPSGKALFMVPAPPGKIAGQVWTLIIKDGNLIAKGPTSTFTAKGKQTGFDGTWTVKFFS